MQRVENLRGRLGGWNPRAQWVQLGLLTASIMAPLIGRWNELRTAERARALREEAETRLRGVRMQLPWQRNDALDQAAELLNRPDGGVIERLSARGKVSTRLWLVGVGVGLIAAGAGAYILVRRRMERSTEEPLVELPLMSAVNGYAQGSGNGLNGSYRTPSVGVARTAAEGLSAPTLTHEQTSSQPVFQPAHPNPRAVAANGSADDDDTAVGEVSRADERTPEDEEVIQLEDAPFIGNIRTMIYHEADDDNLPSEENRIYFMSEEEARAAGYRRDRDEVTATEAESQAQSNA